MRDRQHTRKELNRLEAVSRFLRQNDIEAMIEMHKMATVSALPVDCIAGSIGSFNCWPPISVTLFTSPRLNLGKTILMLWNCMLASPIRIGSVTSAAAILMRWTSGGHRQLTSSRTWSLASFSYLSQKIHIIGSWVAHSSYVTRL